jgi:hypothetical protein
VAIAAPASAQQQQDGLINVAIGDITLEDVNIGVAALVAAQVCGVQVGPVVLLAQRVDATSQQRTVCSSRRAASSSRRTDGPPQGRS